MPARFISAACALLAMTSFATARPATFTMTCAEAASLVAAEGAIVLTTGRHTFDRFVAHPGYCMLGEYADVGWAPTADALQCTIGYVCRYRPAPWEWDD
jgi:hypothetical protein